MYSAEATGSTCDQQAAKSEVPVPHAAVAERHARPLGRRRAHAQSWGEPSTSSNAHDIDADEGTDDESYDKDRVGETEDDSRVSSKAHRMYLCTARHVRDVLKERGHQLASCTMRCEAELVEYAVDQSARPLCAADDIR